ncbi:formylglycine-generating enzyme family protein [Pseudokineococcus basanitobsidens]|uniref:Formylglycine-generating enzyme family protein n=1 Tax=Pseudokineococcus basanitobsidens TaxID=1926649 RepID=A0ABU8RNL0_9ACTN
MSGDDAQGRGRPACCAPSAADVVQPTQGPVRGPLPSSATGPAAAGGAHGDHRVEQVVVPAQTFLMGDARGDGRPADGETPVHEVELDAFSVDATTVTNSDFARFVDATGFRTEAEVFGYSAVFHLALAAPPEDVLGQPPQTPWWLGVRGADWRHPGGARSDLDGLADHPVVHVSWNDAVAYGTWAGRSLPSEAQWECASRGGLVGARYPWGDELTGEWACNIWQGDFPTRNTREDGFLTTAPVRTYAPNAYGLWQTVGNVWEWCADWSAADTYRRSPRHDPRGPEAGAERVMRGGSYLCHDSYCNRYRCSARSSNTPDSSTGNAGFRTVGRA